MGTFDIEMPNVAFHGQLILSESKVSAHFLNKGSRKKGFFLADTFFSDFFSSLKKSPFFLVVRPLTPLPPSLS